MIKIKVSIFLLIITTTTSLSSCFNNSINEEILDGEDYFEYTQDMSAGFFVDSQGNIYYKDKLYLEESETALSQSSDQDNSNHQNQFLYKVDFGGNLIESFDLGEIYFNYDFIIDENKMYYSLPMSGVSLDGNYYNAVELYEFDLNLKAKNLLYKFDSYSNIKKLALIDDKLFFLAIAPDRINPSETLLFDDNYIYKGEVLVSYDINNKKYTELPLENPVAFSVTSDNNLLIYAHDYDGYYFTKYDIKSSTFGEKKYRNLGNITEFVLCNNDKDIIFDNQNMKFVVQITSIIKDEGIRELMPDVGLVDTGITYFKGYAIYYNNLSKKTERIKIATYDKKNKTINLIYTNPNRYFPFGCGYNIDSQKIDNESFAVSVLSRDKEYDLYLMDSRENFSKI